jgi:hypothetical protein
MKPLFFLMLVSGTIQLQAQSVCKIYQYPAGDSTGKKLVVTRNYDEAGNLTKEVVRGYIRFLNNVNTMYCHKEDGIYEYLRDTVHYKTVITFTDDVTGRPIDSNKIFYYYDSASRVIKEVTAMHLKKRVPGKKPGSFRKTIEYTYGADGRVTQKSGTYNKNTVEYMVYDNAGRLLIDSVRSVDMTEQFSVITKFEYTQNGYREYCWMSERKYPAITEYKLDEKGRIIEQTLWFHKDDENGACRNMAQLNWNAFLKNDLKQYREYERAETRYDDQGRELVSLYYFEGKHTTTHEFVYVQEPVIQKL